MFAHIVIFVFYWIENIVGKGENAVNQHFLFFSQSFQKASSPEFLTRVVKTRVKGAEASECKQYLC